MKKKFAIVLALFLIAIVACAGCILPSGPINPVEPVEPVNPVEPVDPITPVEPEEPEKPVDPVVPAEGDFTVTFMMNSAVDNGVYLTVYVDEGETVTEPAVPEKPKATYVFVKWTTDKDNRNAYDFTTPVTADLVLYADWDVMGTSSGSSHTHSYTAVITAPTCTEDGFTTYTCTCGYSYKGDTVPKLGHTFTNAKWENGERTCSVCLVAKEICSHPTTYLSGTQVVCDECKMNLGEVIAKIRTNYYASFESAMEKAADLDTITLLAAVTNGKVTKRVVIDTNKTTTSLNYVAELTVADIKINQSNAEHLSTVMFGEEEVFFERNADDSGYAADKDGNLIVAYTKKDTTYTVYTKNGEGLQMALDAINAAGTGDFTVNLAADITGDVTVEQKPDVKITINGNNKKFDGAITVDSKSARYETAALTIKSVNFASDSVKPDTAFINLGVSGDTSTRYSNHVTVMDCTFTDTDGGDTIVAVKSYTGGDWNLVIDGCTVNAGMHSMLQVSNVEEGLQITNCKVYSKNGINLNYGPSLKMSGCTFDVTGYAVRFGVNGATVNGNFEIKDSTLTSANDDADAVIIFRGTMTGSTLYLTDTSLDGSPAITGKANIICKISTPGALFAFAKSVNEGNDYKGNTVMLIDDIDLNNEPWTPIGQTGAEFKGVFDGQGKTISNLNIDSSAQTGANYSSGLFGWIESHDQDITIKNVIVNGATVKGHHNVAVIAGYLEGDSTVENCHVSNAELTNTHANGDACGDKTGVIAGYVAVDVTIKDCTAEACTLTIDGRDAGQLLGASYVTPSGSSSATNVVVSPVVALTCTDTRAGQNINNDLIGRKLS